MVRKEAPLVDRLARIADLLEAALGRPDVSGFRGDPLDTLVGTILSQSTSDRNSHRAHAALRERFPAWEDALEAGPEEIERVIRAGGLARQKSVRIHAILAAISEERGKLDLSDLCSWPDDEVFRWLGRFTGIGTKTIAVVLMFACGRDICPVDTHVHRIARRLGLVRQKASADETFAALRPEMPPGRAAALHINLIRFGRTRCSARNPGCDGCPLRDECRYDAATGAIRTRPKRKRAAQP